MRIKIDEKEKSVIDENDTLGNLIVSYAENKRELDSYKKICDKENAEIKELMLNSGYTEYPYNGYIAKYSVETRETMNEPKLIDILKECGYTKDIIKTKEYVDMDALEKVIYNESIPKEILLKLDTARESKEVVKLRVTKQKRKENN